MKKIGLATIVLFLIASSCFAAGSFVLTTDTIIRNWGTGQVTQRVLTLTFTGDASDGIIPSLTLSSTGWTDGTNTGTFDSNSEALLGWFLYQVEIDGNLGGTEPTENSELYIYKNSFDLLGGNGVDQVDNSAERIVFCTDGSVSIKAPITDTIVITVTQQSTATNSATGTIKLVMTSN